ncbi:hypothetical protein QR680_005498 [Steinernema hermaphroditum]|uniref:EGF-like domain-containing protein n=1 Tax=Steinernema hermaphroditum TaxID=289476 RepID=A0AA39HS84_9BILA|nr:hypothetical protein QR680_005498 [Steinernema hermaphroditum]
MYPRTSLLLLLLLGGVAGVRKTHRAVPVATKSVIDFCDVGVPGTCGDSGVCVTKDSGNRCRCPDGWMGRGCKRPCQDIYRSCERWHEERRCVWTRPISPFFEDNCALSCGRCVSNGRKLPLALPPVLEFLSWFIGRWTTETTSGDRFPVPMSGPYRETLEIQISDVPSFDRPPLNVSVFASTKDGDDEHREVGFMTVKPFREDTGFAEFDKPAQGDDLVAIEMNSNTGLITIEEGTLQGTEIRLEVRYKKSFLGPSHPTVFAAAKRSFRLLADDVLEERVVLENALGERRKWLKRYRKTFDYLKDF